MKRDLSSVTVVLSHERSGSHVFTSYLASNPAIEVVDEVCNVDALDPRQSQWSYFNYVNRRVREGDERVIRPSVANKMQFVADYFEFLTTTTTKRIAVDIKYNHLHNFEGHWAERWARPLLFNMGGATGMRFIHLRRKLAANAVISAMLAEHNQVWHVRRGEIKALQPVAVDLQMFSRKYEFLARTIAFMEGRVRPARCLDLYYEDLFDSGELKAELGHKLSRFLEIPRDFSVSPRLEKMAKNLTEQITNYSAVKQFCDEKKIPLA